MSGNSIFETSPTGFTDAALALRERLVNNRKLLFAVVSGVVILVASSLLVVNLASSSTATKTTNAAAVKVDIGDPLVILAPSDGRNGTALALVNGKPLFPLPGSGVLSYGADVPVEAQDVKVEQITADQGFWMGANDEQRVFVHVPSSAIAKGALAPSALQEGQTVNVSGRVKAIPSDPTTLGVTDTQLTQLNDQSEYIEANSVRLPS